MDGTRECHSKTLPRDNNCNEVYTSSDGNRIILSILKLRKRNNKYRYFHGGVASNNLACKWDLNFYYYPAIKICGRCYCGSSAKDGSAEHIATVKINMCAPQPNKNNPGERLMGREKNSPIFFFVYRVKTAKNSPNGIESQYSINHKFMIAN